MDMTPEKLAGYIDHTILKAETTSEDIKQTCREAKEYGFRTVFTNGRWVSLVADVLADSKVNVGGVVSLPLGANTTNCKIAQAKELIMLGADEVDMVADLAAIIEGDEKYLRKQFEAIVQVCRSMRPAVTFKVIIESAALTTDQKVFVCRIADKCGVDFVKTSTGLHPAGGATVEDIELMKEFAPNCKVKAAGGIRTLDQALAMIEAGAERLGTSAGIAIIEKYREK